jgi:hypothetical protein
MPEERLIYKGQDISLDLILSTGKVVEIIASAEQTSFDQAYRRFLASKTYAALQKPTTLMWAESAEYIADRYFEETQSEQ